MNPVLSLITGKVGRDASFQRLVDSIVANTAVSWELVVSDASEVPYSPGLTNIRVIHEKPRLTCVHGYNTAFRTATGKWCLFLNDDAEVCAGYDKSAVGFMENNLTIGLGALHYSEGGSPFHVNQAYSCIYPNFGIIRRTFGNDIGWFDEELTMYGADNSIAFRTLLSGYGIADIPEARVIHHSEKDQTRSENQRLRQRDNDVLTKKYMPLRKEWTATYNRLRVNTGTIPWSHGVSPSTEYYDAVR